MAAQALTLSHFLEQRGIPTEIIRRLEEEKIDKDVIPLMEDRELAKYISSYGDRLAITNFCKNQTPAHTRKMGLFEKLRAKLQLQKHGNETVDVRPKGTSSGSHPRKRGKASRRKIEIGWLHHEGKAGVKQMRTKQGGGTRTIEVDVECGLNVILEKGKQFFFPNGISTKGHENQFNFQIWDYKHNPINEDVTIGLIYDTLCMPRLRFYIATFPKEGVETETDAVDHDRQVIEIPDDSEDNTDQIHTYVLNPEILLDPEIIFGPSSVEYGGENDDTEPFVFHLSQQPTTADASRDAALQILPSMPLAASDPPLPSMTLAASEPPLPSMALAASDPPLPSMPLAASEPPLPSMTLAASDPPLPSMTLAASDPPLPSMTLAASDPPLPSMPLAASDPPLPSMTLAASEPPLPSMTLAASDPPLPSRPKLIVVHHGNCLNEMINEFMDPAVLTQPLTVKRLLPDNTEEMGVGSGVLRDVFSSFWQEFYDRCTIGTDAKIPFIRHDYNSETWKAIGRVLVVGYKTCNYLPIKLALPLLEEIVYGKVSSDLLSTFMRFVSAQDSIILQRALEDFTSVNFDELLEVLETYECRRLVVPDTFKETLLEISHKELVQKPMYVIDCWREVIQENTLLDQDELHNMIAKLTPTPRKVQALLHFPEVITPKQREVENHLKRYLRELDDTKLSKFLRFSTGSDILTCDRIEIMFSNMSKFTRRPIAHTCGCVLELSDSYDGFPDFRSDFNDVLNSNIWIMDIV